MKKGFALVEVLACVIIISCLIAWMTYGSKKEKTPPVKQLIEQGHQAASVQNIVVLQDAFERAKLMQGDILTNTTVADLCSDLKARNLLDNSFSAEHVAIQSGSISEGSAVFILQP